MAQIGEYALNLFPLNISQKVKRIYFYNQNSEPDTFSRNLSRVNHISFITSKDLVWVELPDLNVQLFPIELEKYKIKEETIENDATLFEKTFYRYIAKLFSENGYIKLSKKNVFIQDSPTPLTSNKEISYYLAYVVKLYNLNSQYYLSIMPKYVFLSTKPVINSTTKTSFVFNKLSGRTFAYISSTDDSLTVSINNQQLTVKLPENYYFNFTSQDAEKYGFSKEIHKIYKEKLPEEIKNTKHSLHFLNTVIDLEKQYKTKPQQIISGINEYQFKDGISTKASDIFKMHPIKNDESIKIALFLSSENQLQELKPTLKELFIGQDGLFIKALKSLNFKKIEFLQNQKTNSSIFFYNPKTFEPREKEQIKTIKEKIYAIIILDYFYGNIVPMIKEFPPNFILLPILKENILKKQIFTINSFAYKILNFTEKSLPYYIKISPNTLFVGIDLSHDLIERKTSFTISAIDSIGKPIYVSARRNLPLNEKFNVEIFQEEIPKILTRYELKYKRKPERIIIIRDGTYKEQIEDIEEIIKNFSNKYAIVEINKNSTINSFNNLQELLIKLNENTSVYFPKTYHNQTSVEINIIRNHTDITNEELMRTIYKTTIIYHPTPYMTLKLPYPLYITDKIGRLGGEWKFYVPYFI